MTRLVRLIALVVAAGVVMALPATVATAGPIDLPPDGEARLTISVVGADDLPGRVELFLTAAGTNMFDTACLPIATEDGAAVTYECTGLMQRAHFLEAGGTVGDEEVAVQCGLPGAFGFVGNLVDLRLYPNVLDCTVTIAEPGVRVFAVDATGIVIDPPAQLELFNFLDGSIEPFACSSEDVGGLPALNCDEPPPGDYEIVPSGDGNFEVLCAPGLFGPFDNPAQGGSVLSFGDGVSEFGEPSIVYTCVIYEFGDFEPGTVNDLFVDILASDPGPDLTAQLVSGGDDRLSECQRVFALSWQCRDLPPAVYTVSATGLLPGQVAAVSCFGIEPEPSVTVDLAATPFGASCTILVETPQIVFENFGGDTAQNYVVLDSAGNDVGAVCGPAVVFEQLAVSCPLPLGDYTVPEQEVAPFGLTEFVCSQDKPWFFENTVTLSDAPAFEDSIVVRCQPGQADRSTFLFVEITNANPAAQLLLNGVLAEENGQCFDEGSGDPDGIIRNFFCEFQGEQTLVPTMSVVGAGLAPTIECRPANVGPEVSPSFQAELTEAQPEWQCLINFRAELPATGSDETTLAIAALGAAFLAAGLALSTLGARRLRRLS